MKKIILLIFALLLVASFAFGASTAQQVEFLIDGSRNIDGTVTSSGKVYFFSAGTTTIKAVYSSKAQAAYDTTTAGAGDPHSGEEYVSLDSNGFPNAEAGGLAEVYADGTYDVYVYNSSDVLQYTLSSVSYAVVPSAARTGSYKSSGPVTVDNITQAYYFDTTSGLITATLDFDASSVSEGHNITFIIVDGSNSVIVSPNSGANIGNRTTYTLREKGQALRIESDGNNDNWSIANKTVRTIDPNNFTSINAAVAVCANEKILIYDSQTLTANLIVPVGCSLEIIEGGYITKASTYTFTINGNFDAGLYQVFSGFDPGDVTFGPGAILEITPSWWKFLESASDTENALALNSVNLARDTTSPQPIIIPPGVYSYNDSWLIGKTATTSYRGGRIWGSGGGGNDSGTPTYGGTVLHYTGSGIGIDFKGSARGLDLGYFTLTGTSSAIGGIRFNDWNYASVNVHDIAIAGFNNAPTDTSYAIKFGDDTNHFTNFHFSNIAITNNYHGIIYDGDSNAATTSSTWDDPMFSTNDGYSIWIRALVSTVFNQAYIQGGGLDAVRIDGQFVADGNPENIVFNDLVLESNGTDSGADTYNIFIRGQDAEYDPSPSTGGLISSVHFNHTTFATDGAELDGDIYLENTWGIEFDQSFSDRGSEPDITYAGLNHATVQQPSDDTEFKIGAINAVAGTMSSGIQMLYPFRADEGIASTVIQDYSQNGNRLALANQIRSRGSRTHAPNAIAFQKAGYYWVSDSDDALHSFLGDGSVTGFFLGKTTEATDITFAAKWDDTADREWLWGTNANDQPYIMFWDESSDGWIKSTSNTAVVEDAWECHSFVYTGGGAAAANFVQHINGDNVTETYANDGAAAFVAMEDLTQKMGSFEDATFTKQYRGQASYLIMMPIAATRQQVKSFCSMLLGYAGSLP